MPGSFGTSPTDDGLVATTESSEKSAVVGSNTGTGAVPAGGVGGVGVFGLTVVPSAAGVFGANNHATAGVGVQGNGPEAGVSGFSEAGVGIRAHSSRGDGTQSFAHSSDHNAVFGSNDAGGTAPAGGAPAGIGVFGLTVVGGAAGVFGANNHASAGVGVQGNGPEAGLSGFSEAGVGIRAHSSRGDGTQSFAHSSDHNAVFGSNDAGGTAPAGGAPAGIGVFGLTVVGGAAGVFGANNHATAGVGVQGNGPEAGLSGFSENGVGGRAFSKNGIGFVAGGPKLAARFDGDVEVSGDVRLTGADLAEHFELADRTPVPPGTVVVLDGCDRVSVSSTAYDPRVAGVVSGASGYRPGILLDHHGADLGREPIALAGKVYCQVDATYGPVRIGDLLTTSPTPGHAMKASDHQRAFGSVLGKAMEALESGTALLPILVTLQ